MMIIRDIVDMVNKEKRKTERTRAAKCAAGYALGLVAVAAVGVAVGMLFAPKSGKETREDIKEKVTDSIETIKDKAQKVKEKLEKNEEDDSEETEKSSEEKPKSKVAVAEKTGTRKNEK